MTPVDLRHAGRDAATIARLLADPTEPCALCHHAYAEPDAEHCRSCAHYLAERMVTLPCASCGTFGVSVRATTDPADVQCCACRDGIRTRPGIAQPEPDYGQKIKEWNRS